LATVGPSDGLTAEPGDQTTGSLPHRAF